MSRPTRGAALTWLAALLPLAAFTPAPAADAPRPGGGLFDEAGGEPDAPAPERPRPRRPEPRPQEPEADEPESMEVELPGEFGGTGLDDPAPAPPPGPAHTPAPAEAAGPARLPVPPVTKLAEADATVREIFKADFAARGAERHAALARKLLAQAGEAGDDPAARYVLLRAARAEAARAGAVDVALQAADAMAAAFAVDPTEAKLDALALAPASPQAAAAYLALGEEAVRSGDAAAASRAAAGAAKASGRVRDPALARRVRALGAAASQARAAAGAAEGAAKRLKADPGDAQAALVLGRHLCFRKGDWAGGLPLLAKGSDAALAALARRELGLAGSGGGTPPAKEMAALGEAWWGYAEKLKGEPAAGPGSRGAYWYAKALPGLGGLARAAAEERAAAEGQPPPHVRVSVRKYAWEVRERVFDESSPAIPDDLKVERRGALFRISGTKAGDTIQLEGRTAGHYGKCLLLPDRNARGWLRADVPAGSSSTIYRLPLLNGGGLKEGGDAPTLERDRIYRWRVAEESGQVTFVLEGEKGPAYTVSVAAGDFQGVCFGATVRYRGNRADLTVFVE